MGRSREVRQRKQRVVPLREILHHHIAGRSPQRAVLQAFQKRLFVHKTAPGGVYQDGTGLHPAKPLPVHEASVFLGQGHGKNDRVGDFKQLFRRGSALHAVSLCPLRRKSRRPGNTVHPKTLLKDLCGPLTDGPESQKSCGLSPKLCAPEKELGLRHLLGHASLVLPPDDAVGKDNLPRRCQEKGYIQLRHRVGVQVRRIDGLNSPFLRLRQVHAVCSCAVDGDNPEVRHPGHLRRSYHQRPVYQRIRFPAHFPGGENLRMLRQKPVSFRMYGLAKKYFHKNLFFFCTSCRSQGRQQPCALPSSAASYVTMIPQRDRPVTRSVPRSMLTL